MPVLNVDEIDPEEFVEEERDTIVSILRNSSDPFARACAWTLLDHYSDPPTSDELLAEHDTVAKQRAES